MRKFRILALVHEELVPPERPASSEVADADWKTEFDVISTLRALGHDVLPLGVAGDLGVLRKAVEEFSPHIAFNLLEDFHDTPIFDQNVVSYLELVRLAYTGCNPRGLLLARDKALSKKLLAYHRIRVPEFVVFRIGRAPRRPQRLHFPLIVKSLTREGSAGVAQASVVEDEVRLAERVRFIHESIGTDAIAESYIDGRELYVGVMGNERLRVLPIWELYFDGMPEGAWRIATERMKWNRAYQKRHGIRTDAARDLVPEQQAAIQRLCRRVYRTLGLSGYARIDLRLDPDGRAYVLEANPNPQLACGEDFAESARRAGIGYEALLQRILSLGLRWRPDRRR